MSSSQPPSPSLQLRTEISRNHTLEHSETPKLVPSDNESVYNLYELDALQRAADEDDKSFIVTYARGEWNPSAIPEIPLGLHTILGLRSSNTGSRDSPTVPDGSHVSPPDLLESVEAVYRSYLEGYIQSTSETAIEELSPLPSNNPGLIEDGLIFPRRPADRSSIASASSSENFCSPIMSREALRRFERVGYLESPMPQNEIGRRAALNRFRPFTKALEDNLNRILHLAKLVFSVDNAAISLVDSDYTHVTVPDADPILVPRGESMCSHTILVKKAHEPMVIRDTLEDWRFKNNGLGLCVSTPDSHYEQKMGIILGQYV